MTRPWGCPKGHAEAWVKDTARDEEGYVIRRRKCITCGLFWTTQEIPIDPDSYWTRAYSRNQARLQLAHRQSKVCFKCGVEYRVGSYKRHMTTRKHENMLVDLGRDRTRARQYGKAWARRHHSIRDPHGFSSA